ncbi:LOW QUALITY PROTEIN: procollagen galactosyltransferase 2-like [Ara ararauna]
MSDLDLGALEKEGNKERISGNLMEERKTDGRVKIPAVKEQVEIDFIGEVTRCWSNKPENGTVVVFDCLLMKQTFLGLRSWQKLDCAIQMFICNRERYGFLPMPLKSQQSLQEETENFVHTLIEAMTPGLTSHLSSLGFRPSDENTWQYLVSMQHIFMLNLKHRKDRWDQVLRTFSEQEIAVKIVEAVGGKARNTSQLKALCIDVLLGSRDAYSSRPTRGEIGCFLSHSYMWKEVANRELEKTLVTEDSVCFENQFKRKLMKLMGDIQQAQPDWELIYIGRKRMRVQEPEKAVPSVMNLVEADYSCWTLGYAVSFQGTQKLIGAEPFSKMLPVGEFLPVMYNKHPVGKYMEYYESSDLEAFSAEPLLVYLTPYTGQPGYLSDTETSTVWDKEPLSADRDRTHSWKSRQHGKIHSDALNEDALPSQSPLNAPSSRDEL